MASFLGRVASIGCVGALAVACAVGQGGANDCSRDDLPDPANEDSNCDGIDGTEADALFVSPDGNDSNPGTKAEPLKTIYAAFLAAPQKKKGQILVAGATYTEPDTLLMPDKVGVYGGYDAKTWQRTSAETRILVAKPLALEARGLKGAATIGRVTIVAADNAAPGGESIAVRLIGVATFFVGDGATIVAGQRRRDRPRRQGRRRTQGWRRGRWRRRWWRGERRRLVRGRFGPEAAARDVQARRGRGRGRVRDRCVCGAERTQEGPGSLVFSDREPAPEAARCPVRGRRDVVAVDLDADPRLRASDLRGRARTIDRASPGPVARGRSSRGPRRRA